ncbi:MAG: polyphosphate kinase 1, partial [Woeseiaceae bacterium]
MTSKPAVRVPLLNRELGILAFNRRVLAQAIDDSVPLLERLRFLTIVSSNLDEFFEIRVAGLKEQIKLGITEPAPDGMTPKEILALVTREARDLVTQQYELLNDVLLPALSDAGVRFLRRGIWNDAQRAWVQDYFTREVLPVLTPIGLDPAHPFPRLFNKSLNFIVELEGRDAFGRGSRVAIVQAPRILPRAIRLPPSIAEGDYSFVFLTSVMHAHVDQLFAGMTIKGCYQFRVTRNSDLFVDEEEIKNLRIALQGELLQRHFGDAVRLEVVEECSPAMIEFLLQQFMLDEQDLYHVDGPVNLYRLREVLTHIDRPDLKYPAFTPSVPAAIEVGDDDLFETIARQDILLHHPYQSFAPVLDFIQSSALDPRVVAIKQTVYRTGADSELMQVLIDAARAGKEVTVVVELLARFDEEANLKWAAQLEEVGAHVVYGVVGHKTHAKMALIVRREPGPDGAVLRRYAHLGTGNYHSATARQYTDFGLLTANEDVCSDVNEVFKQLTGLGRAGRLKHVWQSPFTLHKRTVEAIRNEARIAAEGRSARIVAKMNALLEPRIIDELYGASQAGVEID